MPAPALGGQPITTASISSTVRSLRDNIARVFLGNPRAVDQVICCLLAKGHVLIEDVPGVGKTVLATSLARSIDCSFSRIQLTPDLLPSDILGVSIFRSDAVSSPAPHASGNGQSVGQSNGQSAGMNASPRPSSGLAGAFEFKRGPIFANIVLADEINRTPPRTQTALLEAMSEATVTVDGRTHVLEQPFMLIATQNPFDFEGTYPLPENQLDRFLMRVSLGYPAAEVEARVLSLRPSENALHELRPALNAADIRALQAQVDTVRMEPALIQYIIALATATRARQDLQVGLSPRGSLALAHAARATAVLQGRDYVIPEDITSNVLPVCAHRIIGRASHVPSRIGLAGATPTYAPDSVEGILLSILDTLESPA